MCHRKPILTASCGSREQAPRVFEPGEIRAFVNGFLQRRDVFLRTSQRHGSPLYVVEEGILLERAERFAKAFCRTLPDMRVYYAMKSNNHPAIAKILVDAGLGLDVSSGMELQIALDCGATDIVFSGPGKTDRELDLAVANREWTTVLMDSRGELQRLQRIAQQKDVRIRAGVRLTTDGEGLWRKFGIPLRNLAGFLDAARKCEHVSVQGLQFHTSWNLEPGAQVNFIARLGDTLGELSPHQQSMVEFVDVGGGFWPEQGEWLQSYDTTDALVPLSISGNCHYRRLSVNIEEFADRIAQAVRVHLLPHVSCRIFTEPGRWLCNDAMHLLLTVVDKKADDLVITDGGTNAVGWERFETDYFPVINLSRPELVERKCHILGSLCTPHDVWGYGYWGKDIQAGDILLIPTQGAYTYSLRQEFIKPLPTVVVLNKTMPYLKELGQ